MNEQSTKTNTLEKTNTINNPEEPKTNNNILNGQSKTMNKELKTISNLEEPKINNKYSDYVKTPEFLISKKLY